MDKKEVEGTAEEIACLMNVLQMQNPLIDEPI